MYSGIQTSCLLRRLEITHVPALQYNNMSILILSVPKFFFCLDYTVPVRLASLEPARAAPLILVLTRETWGVKQNSVAGCEALVPIATCNGKL